MSKVMAVSPLGKVQWFSLNKEDKFGAYTANLILEENPETLKFISQIDGMLPAGGTKLPYKKESNGSFVIKLKLKARGQKKDVSTYEVNPPVVYDGTGTKLDAAKVEAMNIGNDSVIRAKVELSAYDFNGTKGVSCKPKSIQISKLVQFVAGGEDAGFDALEFSEFDSSAEQASPSTNDDF